MARVGITDTTLRDGHQSLWATRMHTVDMVAGAEIMDSIGYHSLEVWGGATFDVCLRYLGDDPWERLREIKKHVKKTPLQMLLRGQSLVGYQHYPDDVVESFVAKSVENGIDIIRIFDALNDIRNLETSIRAGKKAGAHIQAAVVYTVSPVHTIEHYVETAMALTQMGADSICIKDMAGLLTPYIAYQLVSLIKEKVNCPVQLHSHYIGGLAVGTYLKAVEAGVDVIDAASVPLAFGASQPPVETVVRALKNTPYDTGLSMKSLFEVADYFERLRQDYGQERGLTRINDMRVFEHQVPGGMITNLISQLEQQKAIDKLPQVLSEIPRVREELGYPPLVTPTSQIVGTQAVLNVITGERYKLVPGEVKSYVQGLYGKPPAPINPTVKSKLLGDRPEYDCRPADLLKPGMEKARRDAGELATSEEDYLSYALFLEVAQKFFAYRAGKPTPGYPPSHSQKTKKDKNKRAVVEEELDMNFSEIKEMIKLINQTEIQELILEHNNNKIVIRKNTDNCIERSKNLETIGTADASDKPTNVKSSSVTYTAKNANSDVGLHNIKAPMVGTFYASPAPDAGPFVRVGDIVKKGQVLCIVEAMKLMNEIESDVSGEIVEVMVENGAAVEYGQPMFLIKTNS